jgi:hypothetical protein
LMCFLSAYLTRLLFFSSSSFRNTTVLSHSYIVEKNV